MTSSLSTTCTRGGIPRIIHQTWKNHDIPYEWQISQDEWQRHHPDWQYILWTDEDIREYMEAEHPEFMPLFNRYPHNIQRVDMMRYFILYDFGGVYCDLDQYPLQNIEEYLETDAQAYFVHSANANCFTNSLMASQRHAPIWKEVHQRLWQRDPWWAVGKHLEVMTSTGPMMLNDVLVNSHQPYAVLPRAKFNPYAQHEIGEVACRKHTVMMSLEGKSWNGIDSWVYCCILKHWTSFVVGVVVAVVAFIIIFLLTRWRLQRIEAIPLTEVATYAEAGHTTLETVDV
jgi:mannosyltransferase OCH1-like enzyme